MTIEELIKKANAGLRKRRKPAGSEEHDLQVACVRWFRMQHRELGGLLFAVPNGGRRDKVTGAKLKEEGVVPGVSDLILLKACGGWHGLLIEMKTKTGRQTESQRMWQASVEKEGYRYEVCRDFKSFKALVEGYLFD